VTQTEKKRKKGPLLGTDGGTRKKKKKGRIFFRGAVEKKIKKREKGFAGSREGGLKQKRGGGEPTLCREKKKGKMGGSDKSVQIGTGGGKKGKGSAHVIPELPSEKEGEGVILGRVPRSRKGKNRNPYGGRWHKKKKRKKRGSPTPKYRIAQGEKKGGSPPLRCTGTKKGKRGLLGRPSTPRYRPGEKKKEGKKDTSPPLLAPQPGRRRGRGDAECPA